MASARQERRRLKKKRKKAARGGVLPSAEDYVGIYGPDARAELEMHTERHFMPEQTALSVKDAQGLLQWAASPVGSVVQPGWAFIKNKPLCRKVVTVVLGGVDAQRWERQRARYPQLCALSPPSQRVRVKLNKYAPAKPSGPESLLSVDLARDHKRARTEPPAPLAKKLAPQELLLSETELVENRYPRPGGDDLDGFIATPAHSGPGEAAAKMFALDCEMCYTELGLELARVTLLSQFGVALLDMLVVPPNPITDYNTAYSGITAATLDGVKTTLGDARAALFAHIHSESILVGHSLENDLRALKLIHGKVIDTALCFPHPEPRYKYGLRALAATHLGRQIQAGAGHDSSEDASAALQLVQLKLQRGLDYAVPKRETGSLFAELSERGRKCALVHDVAACRGFGAEPVDTIPADTIPSVVKAASPLVKRETEHFVWVNLPGPDGSGDEEGGWMEAQDQAVAELAAQCPRCTLLVVVAMHQPPASNAGPRQHGQLLLSMTQGADAKTSK